MEKYMVYAATELPGFTERKQTRPAGDPLRPAGVIFAAGLLVATIIMSAPKFIRFSSFGWTLGWLSNAVPFVLAAVLLVRTDVRRRVLGCALIVTAGIVVLFSRGNRLLVNIDPSTGEIFLHRSQWGAVAWTLADVAGLAGWFVLRRRPPLCYALLAPMAFVGYLLATSSWVYSRREQWLHDAGFAWPTVAGTWSLSNVLWQVSTFLSMALAVLLAYAAALWARRQPTDQAGRAAPEADVAFARPAGDYAPGPSAHYAPARAGGYGSAPDGSRTPASTGTAGYPGQGSTNGSAVASLVCGLIGMLAFFPAAVAAIVCGHVARRQIARTGDRGSGMALAGLILGYLGLVVVVLVTVLFVVVAGVMSRSGQ